MTRSDSLVPPLRLPTHGYTQGLLGELSSPGTEGLSSFRIPLHSMSPLIPRRWEPPFLNRLVRFLLPSRVIDRLGHRAFVLRGYVCVRITLRPGALRTSFRGLVGWLHRLALAPRCLPRYETLSLLISVGLSPTGLCVLRWTRLFASVLDRVRWLGQRAGVSPVRSSARRRTLRSLTPRRLSRHRVTVVASAAIST
jgi:hypothetical protein